MTNKLRNEENTMNAEILVDYLTFTVMGIYTPNEVIEDILCMDSALFEDTGKGFDFYKNSKQFNNITVRYNGDSFGGYDMGISVCMSGQGCRAYEEYHGESIMLLLQTIYHSDNIHATRIDVACDDKEGILDMDDIWDYANRGAYRTRMRSRDFRQRVRIGDVKERTVYFGSKTSLFIVRIYDKAKEFYHPKYETENYFSHWIRFEMVFKDIYANQAISSIVEASQIGSAVAGLLNDRFTFIEVDDMNISRCSVCSWWSNFVDSVSRIHMTTREKVKHTIEQSLDHLQYAYSRIITKVIEAVGEHSFICNIIDVGKTKLTDSDKAQIDDYKIKSYNDFWEPITGYALPRQKRTLKNINPSRVPLGDVWKENNFIPYQQSFFPLQA